MKLLLSALALTFLAAGANAQAPAQSLVPAGDRPVTTADVRKLLEATKEANAKLLEQQAKTLQMLEELEKTAQTLKTLGKRG